MNIFKRILGIIVLLLVFVGMVPLSGFISTAYDNLDSSYNYPIRSIATTGRGFSSSHGGVDFTISKGTSVYSSKKGTVKIVYSGCKNNNGAGTGNDCKSAGCTSSVKTYMNGSDYKAGYYCNYGFGNGVVIQNDDGLFCYYAHLSSVTVKVGDSVTPNTKIGEVGSAGCSTGPHLHFSVSNKQSGGTNYDPFKYIFPGYKITITNNGSGSVNPKLTVYFPWKDFEATKCQINFGTSASNLSQTSYDSNFTASSCFYNLGSKFGNLTKGKTYYFKVTIIKNGTTYNSSVYSFVAGDGDKTLLDYSSVKSNNVTVSFDANGGVSSKSSIVIEAGTKYGYNLPVAYGKEGYSFAGWYTSKSGGSWAHMSSYADKNVTKLYAHWVKNSSDVLQVGHIYKIINKNSGLPLATSGAGAGNPVKQQTASDSTKQLWRVTYADENGYYGFESLYGGMAMDLDTSNTKRFNPNNKVHVYTPSDHEAQRFSLVYNSKQQGYSMHGKWAGYAIDVDGNSKNAGAQIVSWWPTFDSNQIFTFEEVETRTVKFYNNYNNNYLPSPAEVYKQEGTTIPQDNYNSRADGVSVKINPTSNSLIITQTVASKDNDMRWSAAIADSNVYGPNAFENTTIELHFKAKASVSGANIQFRWGYDSVDKYYPAALTTEWKDYTIEIPRTKYSGRNLHPYIDKACTVEIKEIAMFAKGGEGYIGDSDYYSPQILSENIYNGVLSGPANPTREGYVFDGWYDKRTGGNLISSDGMISIYNLPGNLCLYAHWIKSNTHTEHTFTTTVIAADCETEGHVIQVCSECGYTIDTVIPALGHAIVHTYQAATCVDPMIEEWVCSRCGYVEFGGGDDPLGHDYYAAAINAAGCDYDGYIRYECLRCGDTYTEPTPAHGHDYGNWTSLNQNLHQRVCTWDSTHIETEPHDWDEGVVTTQPSATTNGVMTYTCTACGATKTDSIAVNYEKIAVKTMPSKTTYYVGEALNTSGLTLTVTFNNGNADTISSGFTCTPTKLSTAGTQKITVSYGGKTASFNVTVKSDTVSSVKIKNQPDITTYYVGDSIDLSGVALTATYASGKTETVYENFTVTPQTLTSVGTQTVTVVYSGVSATFTVQVIADKMQEISIATLPNIVDYYVGDTVSINGLTLNVIYASGKVETVDRGFTVSPSKLQREGMQTVVVQYQGVMTSFEVAVEELPVASHKVNYIVDGKSYYTGAYQEGFAIISPTTPTKPGYLFNEWSPALPAAMPGYDLTVNAVFTPIKYTAEFIADGATIGAVAYTVEDQKIQEPAIPSKTGYTAKWSDYTLDIGGIKVYAVYTKIETPPVPQPTVAIHNYKSTRSEDYKTTLTFTADATNLPEGAVIQWVVNGKDAETGATCTVKQATADYTVQCKVIKDGQVLAESAVETVKINTGFFAKIVAFFRGLFGRLPVIEQAFKEF